MLARPRRVRIGCGLVGLAPAILNDARRPCDRLSGARSGRNRSHSHASGTGAEGDCHAPTYRLLQMRARRLDCPGRLHPPGARLFAVTVVVATSAPAKRPACGAQGVVI